MVKAFFIVIVVIVLAGAGFYFFAASQSGSDGAELLFKGPEKVFYGVPFELSIGVSNNSTELWRNVSLSLALPQGMVFADGGGNKSLLVKEIGNLGAGSLTETKFQLMAVAPGEESLSTEIVPSELEAQLSYVPANINSVFEKKEAWQTPAPEPAIQLSLTAPEKIGSGEEVKIKMAYANKTTEMLDNLSVRFIYPPSFVFTRASVEPDFNNTLWNIGAPQKDSSDTIMVFGHITEATSSEFMAVVTRAVSGFKQPIATARVAIAVDQPPLTVAVDVNDAPDYVARLGEQLHYTIGYSFEKNPPAASLAVRVKLFGLLFDFPTLAVNDGGVFQSRGNEIVWTLPSGEISGEGGSVSFSIKTKPDYGIKRLGDRNFVLKVRAEVRAGSTVGTAEREIKVAGDTRVEARGYFRDADSGILNKGMVPPRVGVATNYTVHWAVKNYATDVKNVVARAVLQPGVRFTGVTKGTVDAKPTYDAATYEVVWKINRISATTGVVSPAPEVIFQIEATPTPDMVGKTMPLTGPVSLSALDDFTGTTISSSAPELTTAVPDDATVAGAGIVIQ